MGNKAPVASTQQEDFAVTLAPIAPNRTPAHFRGDLVRALRLDLIGPEPGDEYEAEILPTSPSRWYLTGFLVPFEAREQAQPDETSTEQLELIARSTAGDDEASPDQTSARRAFFPSSIGISVLVPQDATIVRATASWGEYAPVSALEGEAPGDAAEGRSRPWRRTPRSASLDLPLPASTAKPARHPIPGSDGLELVVSVRPINAPPGAVLGPYVPAGSRSVSVFLVNNKKPSATEKDEAFVFQVAIALELDQSFVARPDIRGHDGDDRDEKVADLQYRDAFEYAVGHGVSTRCDPGPEGDCHSVRTTWVPQAEVEKVVPTEIPGVELGMEALGSAPTAAALKQMVGSIADQYGTWIGIQRQVPGLDTHRQTVADDLLQRADLTRRRILDSFEALSDPLVFEAFRIANIAMAQASRQRRALEQRQAPGAVSSPKWRPFQLAFVLMNLRGLESPDHADRDIVDLLFFPTGGGKTEAYLGLAAISLALRRLRNPGLAGAGVSVIMRYTLRLLTLDQLGRAAAVVCALELERERREKEGHPHQLGTWPFEIGLWVGRAATPNKMGRVGDKDENSARTRTIAFQNDSQRKPSPIPIEDCPWCGERFRPDSFALVQNPKAPTELRIKCVSFNCAFSGRNRRSLPIVAVDDSLYRRLPCFIIATVDKFASLPWVGQTGALFGRVSRHDREGFYGPADPDRGTRLDVELLPPDLIIQDELHLISGPLGTMVGLYETAIDALCSREHDGKTIRPKIIASTATVRRAEAQIRALFGRTGVEIFPPPGPDRRESFFARTVPSSDRHARLYLGIAAQGRSLKVVLLRTYLALLSAAQKAYLAEGGDGNTRNPVDPYMTLLGYFNSLRELGGSRRIVEDEVQSRLKSFGQRLRGGEKKGVFADRTIAYEAVELTSRETTNKVAETKRRLALSFHEKERVDVALATNMISVGLDITRLGLMVVLGQPKTTSEYIQATSRVGRDDERPGLVVTLLNLHRPRDRSHYERFEAYHASFYRAVEATSVTPFSPRAIDRGIAAVTVALARLGLPALTAATQAAAITTHRTLLDFVAEAVSRRAANHDRNLPAQEVEELRKKMRDTVNRLLDSWDKVAQAKLAAREGLQYQREEGRDPPLLYDPLDPELARQPKIAQKFKAHRSLRDVEPSVNLWARRPDNSDLPEDEE